MLAALPVVATPAAAHGIDAAPQGDGHVVMAFRFLGGEPMAGVAARIFRPGEPDTAAFTATADAAGRVAFTADRDGVWRIDLVAADGHLDRTLVRVQDGLSATPGSPIVRWLLAVSLTCNLVTFLLVAAPRLRHPGRRRTTAAPVSPHRAPLDAALTSPERTAP